MHRRNTISSRRWCLGRGVSAVLAAALSILASAARAGTGFTSSATLSTTQDGPTLANGTVYFVPSDATIDRPSGSTQSAMYVADGATAVIYIPKNVTLTVCGGNASGTESAGAGIRLYNGSTLIVTGGGTLNVTGGNAATGGNAWENNGTLKVGDGGGNIYIGYDSIGRFTLAFIGATTPQGEDASASRYPVCSRTHPWPSWGCRTTTMHPTSTPTPGGRSISTFRPKRYMTNA